MDKFLYALGLLCCAIAVAMAWYFPLMPAWVFISMCGAAVIMMAADTDV